MDAWFDTDLEQCVKWCVWNCNKVLSTIVNTMKGLFSTLILFFITIKGTFWSACISLCIDWAVYLIQINKSSAAQCAKQMKNYRVHFEAKQFEDNSRDSQLWLWRQDLAHNLFQGFSCRQATYTTEIFPCSFLIAVDSSSTFCQASILILNHLYNRVPFFQAGNCGLLPLQRKAEKRLLCLLPVCGFCLLCQGFIMS